MKPIQIKNDLHIALPDYFDLEQIFTCGQNFRFDRKSDGNYCGVALGQVLRLKQQDNTLILYDTDEKAFEEIWMSYFALDIDYGTLRKQLDTDPPMRRALAYGYGIRILKQDLWEMIVTFLISQNNNIPRIKKIVTALCTCSNGIPDPPCRTNGLPLTAVLISSRRSKFRPAQFAGYLPWIFPIPAAKKSTPKSAIVLHSSGSANSPADMTPSSSPPV